MLNVIIFFFFVLPQVKKTTASSIVVAYMGRFNSQFNEFRTFKVLFCLVLRMLMFVLFLILFTDCGHRRTCISNARKHHDNQCFGVVFVSSP